MCKCFAHPNPKNMGSGETNSPDILSLRLGVVEVTAKPKKNLSFIWVCNNFGHPIQKNMGSAETKRPKILS